jgi:hypothetical protein
MPNLLARVRSRRLAGCRRQVRTGKGEVLHGTDAMTVSNKTANVPGTTAIVANGMCKMTLTNVRAHGETGLVANGGVHVIVNGGAISGTTNSVIANGGAVVELRGGAKIEGSVVENGGARIVR